MSIKDSLILLALLASVILAQASFQTTFYKSIGTVKSSISTSFTAHVGISKVRCLGKCTQDKCLMVGWGHSETGEPDCRILETDTLPETALAHYSPVTGPLTLYTSSDSILQFVQKDYALMLLSPEKRSWQDTRAFCRGYGLGLFMPTNMKDLRDLQKDYSTWWAGASDLDKEGTYKTVEGELVPDDFWCYFEPNNFLNENCMEVEGSACLNDETCSVLHKGFCKIGK